MSEIGKQFESLDDCAVRITGVMYEESDCGFPVSGGRLKWLDR